MKIIQNTASTYKRRITRKRGVILSNQFIMQAVSQPINQLVNELQIQRVQGNRQIIFYFVKQGRKKVEA